MKSLDSFAVLVLRASRILLVLSNGRRWNKIVLAATNWCLFTAVIPASAAQTKEGKEQWIYCLITPQNETIIRGFICVFLAIGFVNQTASSEAETAGYELQFPLGKLHDLSGCSGPVCLLCLPWYEFPREDQQQTRKGSQEVGVFTGETKVQLEKRSRAGLAGKTVGSIITHCKPRNVIDSWQHGRWDACVTKLCFNENSFSLLSISKLRNYLRSWFPWSCDIVLLLWPEHLLLLFLIGNNV